MEKIETEDHTVNQEKKDISFALVSAVGELYSNNEYCDVTILVGNRSFRSHRLLLAAFSEYFHAMFGGKFKESHVKEDEPVVLRDVVNSESFEVILHFLYFGDVINITDSNVYAVLTTVDFLRLKNPIYIETKCIELIRENVDGSEVIPDAIKIFTFSCVTKKKVLVDLLRKHICQHLRELSIEDTFENISFEDLKELLERGYPFWMCDQDVVLNFLIGWVHHFRERRKHHFRELVRFVDLKRVSTDCIFFLLNDYEELIDRRADNGSFKLFPTSSVEDYSQSEVTFTFVKDNFSAWKENEIVFSQKVCFTRLPNFSWQMSLKRTTDHLEFFLRCDGSPLKKWVCSVKFNSLILSQEKEQPHYINECSEICLFNEISFSWGWKNFAEWDDITDPESGLIKDDIVIFQAQLIPI